MSPHDPNFQLGVISGKIDLVLVQLAASEQRNAEHFSRIEASQTAQDEAHSALAEDVAALKRDRSWVLGAAATVSAIAGAAGSYLMGR